MDIVRPVSNCPRRMLEMERKTFPVGMNLNKMTLVVLFLLRKKEM